MDVQILNEYYLIIKNKITNFNFESALSSIDKLITNFPANPSGYYYKGVCQFALEKYDDALYAYIKAISLDITYAKAYFNLGVVYYLKNQYDDALINIAKAFIIFTKQRELDCRQRCKDALNFIESQRKSFD